MELLRWKMIPGKREVRVHRRLHDGIFAADEPADSAAPAYAVVDDEKLRTRGGRGLDAPERPVDRKRDKAHVVAFARNLKAVVAHIVEISWL